MPEFVAELTKLFSDTTAVTLVQGAADRDSTQLIFSNLSATINEVETVVLTIISLMVIIIIMLISVMLIGDSKKLAAILKSLGYSDRDNALSFLAIYIPVIIIGLAIAVPLSIGILVAFQAAIFSGANIMILAGASWSYFLIATGAVLGVLLIAGFSGY
ncbi:hypothetical protein Barb6_03747 [Bacteroidales bacterium Barb6]|nr:hypothetical protein Barb6_03747 [Bacteroidales bacterium Barb6]OAV63509.1 hypothetical protein Barb4_05058 [Bacteroidales bacterium Barb4]